MTREGFVAYFWGDHATPESLVGALRAARCRYAIHLDMNGANTGFELYRVGRPVCIAAARRARPCKVSSRPARSPECRGSSFVCDGWYVV